MEEIQRVKINKKEFEVILFKYDYLPDTYGNSLLSLIIKTNRYQILLLKNLF